ncbi:MAG: GNAT family N-acetyltransferase [Candidatus Neomarinimicrobiota bacterium]
MIRIRKATKEDQNTIVEFSLAMARETEDKNLDTHRLMRGVARVFTSPGKGLYLIAEVEGTIAGQLLITSEWSDWRNAEFWWIQSVYVHPEFRRRGVYRSLHNETLKRAREEGNVCGFRLYVHGENSLAQQAYGRLGMKISQYMLMECEPPFTMEGAN